ncbi:MAG: TonB family protein [Acidobacteriota bacterium]
MKLFTHVASITTYKSSLFLIFAAIFASSVLAQTAKPTPKTIIGGILNGKAILLPKPEYPAEARKNKVTGTVKVQVIIDETGKVVSAHTVGGIDNASMRAAAEIAAQKAVFAPTLLSGSPVKVSGVINYNFVAETSNEEKLKIMELAAVLTSARRLAAKYELFTKAFEVEDFTDATNDYPEYAADLKELTSLNKMTAEKRIEMLDRSLAGITSKLNSDGKWQFAVGKDLGEILTSLMLFIDAQGGDNIDMSKIDTAGLKLTLNNLRDLVYSAPQDFPKDVLDKLKIFADVGEKEDLSKRESLKDFFEKMMALIQTVSPDAN